MKASLQLKLGQQLTMTPQLQQAIRLLQLSSLELQQEIQEALEANPLLEMAEDNQDDAIDDNHKENDAGELSAKQEDGSTVETSEALNNESMPDELPMDTTWDEVFTAASASGPAMGREDDMPFQGKPAKGSMNIWNGRRT